MLGSPAVCFFAQFVAAAASLRFSSRVIIYHIVLMVVFVSQFYRKIG